MLVIWVIGFPLGSLIHLVRNRANLNDEVFFSRYRMLYQGLKRKHFYWEIVNTFRKISIVSIDVFLSLYPDYIKAIYAMLILSLIFKAQETLKPYEIPAFNWIEQREQIASIVTFYAGLYFVKANVSNGLKYIIIFVVFLVNAWFLVIWGYVALLQFRWAWTRKIANILKKFICKRLRDEDLKPVDENVLGVSGATSVNTKQASSSLNKNEERDFDAINQSDRTLGPANGPDNSQALINNDEDFQNEDSLSKKRKGKTSKKLKNDFSHNSLSSSFKSKDDNSVSKGLKTEKTQRPFDQFQEKVEKEQNRVVSSQKKSRVTLANSLAFRLLRTLW